MGKCADRGRNAPHAIARDGPGAIALIKEEHRMFRALFDKAEKLDGEPLVSLTGEICLRLTVHMMVEEEILYPALKLVLSAEEVDEGIIEHNLARNLIFDLMAMTGHEETYKVKVHVLGEEVMHHIDEEDRGLLEHARKTWEEGKIDLDLLGYRLCDRRQDWYDRIAALGDDGLVADVEPVGDAVEEARSPQSVE